MRMRGQVHVRTRVDQFIVSVNFLLSKASQGEKASAFFEKKFLRFRVYFCVHFVYIFFSLKKGKILSLSVISE
jgi:hypothetical protein